MTIEYDPNRSSNISLVSYIDGEKIICSIFKTSDFNSEGNVGGNLHCLVKNQY